MRVYRLNVDGIRRYRSKRTHRILTLFALDAAGLLLLGWLWGNREGESTLWWAVGVFIQAGIFSTMMNAFAERRIGRWKLVVDELQMRESPDFPARAVHRNSVRTVIDGKGGLVLSERGPVAARFLGGVWIPRELEEYEEVRELAFLWQTAPKDASFTG